MQKNLLFDMFQRVGFEGNNNHFKFSQCLRHELVHLVAKTSLVEDTSAGIIFFFQRFVLLHQKILEGVCVGHVRLQSLAKITPLKFDDIIQTMA